MAETAGEVLRSARRRVGLSQSALAQRAGVAQSVISVYESGRRQPSLPMLQALVDATGAHLRLDITDVTRAPGVGLSLDEVRGHADAIHRAAAVEGVTILGVFGSVARGDAAPDSDLDILIESSSGVGIFALGRLRAALERLLGVEVDLVPSAGLKPQVRETVSRDLIRL